MPERSLSLLGSSSPLVLGVVRDDVELLPRDARLKQPVRVAHHGVAQRGVEPLHAAERVPGDAAPHGGGAAAAAAAAAHTHTRTSRARGDVMAPRSGILNGDRRADGRCGACAVKEKEGEPTTQTQSRRRRTSRPTSSSCGRSAAARGSASRTARAGRHPPQSRRGSARPAPPPVVSCRRGGGGAPRGRVGERSAGPRAVGRRASRMTTRSTQMRAHATTRARAHPHTHNSANAMRAASAMPSGVVDRDASTIAAALTRTSSCRCPACDHRHATGSERCAHAPSRLLVSRRRARVAWLANQTTNHKRRSSASPSRNR